MSVVNENLSTTITLRKIAQHYFGFQNIGWTVRIIQGKRFEFHIVSSYSSVCCDILADAKKANIDRSERVPEKLAPSELLLIVVHSKDFIPVDKWIKEALTTCNLWRIDKNSQILNDRYLNLMGNKIGKISVQKKVIVSNSPWSKSLLELRPFRKIYKPFY